MKESGTLQDSRGKIWAKFNNARESYGAIVAESEICDMPSEFKAIFDEHEQRVLRQELAFLDDLEEKIDGFDLWIVWDGEQQRIKVWDVQVPEGGLSFRLSKPGESSKSKTE